MAGVEARFAHRSHSTRHRGPFDSLKAAAAGKLAAAAAPAAAPAAAAPAAATAAPAAPPLPTRTPEPTPAVYSLQDLSGKGVRVGGW